MGLVIKDSDGDKLVIEKELAKSAKDGPYVFASVDGAFVRVHENGARAIVELLTKLFSLDQAPASGNTVEDHE